MATPEAATPEAAAPTRHATYLVPVLRSSPVTPRMLRLTLGGQRLRGFAAGRDADERVKLFFPPRGLLVPALPEFGPDGMRYPDGAVIPHARNYTVRSFDPELLELDLDFVIHNGGHAAEWARDARPGDLLGIAGPAVGGMPSDAADTHVIAGDETALPAIASILERLPATARAEVFIEVVDAAEEQHLTIARGAHVTVHWLHRGTGPWTTPTPLERAVRELPWPAGAVHAWVAGEAAVVRALRRYLRQERGLPREAVHATGYWRLGKTVEQWLSEEGDPRTEDD
ncbi:siderophore-interacting protein [Streptomyces sp. NPDC059063]|uniref:siderophore-interacting protein n=1 Tax=unclassified Streptomyces TaxID=2593676 RepID=UPI0036BAB1AE